MFDSILMTEMTKLSKNALWCFSVAQSACLFVFFSSLRTLMLLDRLDPPLVSFLELIEDMLEGLLRLERLTWKGWTAMTELEV